MNLYLDFTLTRYSRIYAEIGPGQRVALSKLAIDSFEGTGRPLRIAVDISIWQFQIQSGKGMSILHTRASQVL